MYEETDEGLGLEQLVSSQSLTFVVVWIDFDTNNSLACTKEISLVWPRPETVTIVGIAHFANCIHFRTPTHLLLSVSHILLVIYILEHQHSYCCQCRIFCWLYTFYNTNTVIIVSIAHFAGYTHFRTPTQLLLSVSHILLVMYIYNTNTVTIVSIAHFQYRTDPWIVFVASERQIIRATR